MSRKDKVNMPSSTAGIPRYFDDYKSRIEFKPQYIVVLVITVILIEVFLHLRGGGIF